MPKIWSRSYAGEGVQSVYVIYCIAGIFCGSVIFTFFAVEWDLWKINPWKLVCENLWLVPSLYGIWQRDVASKCRIMIMWTICCCLDQVWESQIVLKKPILLHILIALPCIAELLLRVVGTNNCADKQPGQYYIIFEDPKSLNESLGCTCVYIALRRLDYKFFKSSYYKTSLCSLELDMSFTQGLYATNLWKVCSVCFTMKRILSLNSSYNNSSVDDVLS